MANAFTSSEHTNYYFDVNIDCFEEALDRYMPFFHFSKPSYFLVLEFVSLCFSCDLLHRFAQFFIKPLMSADATTREIKAVDSG